MKTKNMIAVAIARAVEDYQLTNDEVEAADGSSCRLVDLLASRGQPSGKGQEESARLAEAVYAAVAGQIGIDRASGGDIQRWAQTIGRILEKDREGCYVLFDDHAARLVLSTAHLQEEVASLRAQLAEARAEVARYKSDAAEAGSDALGAGAVTIATEAVGWLTAGARSALAAGQEARIHPDFSNYSFVPVFTPAEPKNPTEKPARPARMFAYYRTRRDENRGQEYAYFAMHHGDTEPSQGERIVTGTFIPDNLPPPTE